MSVPKLRFPEFRDAGEWGERRLEEFLTESRVIGRKGDVAKKLLLSFGVKVFFKRRKRLKEALILSIIRGNLVNLSIVN
ncbi:MAG: hypothetical protein AAGA75_14850 [Cyanobacteria bacterium P01_E01_bin.6]